LTERKKPFVSKKREEGKENSLWLETDAASKIRTLGFKKRGKKQLEKTLNGTKW